MYAHGPRRSDCCLRHLRTSPLQGMFNRPSHSPPHNVEAQKCFTLKNNQSVQNLSERGWLWYLCSSSKLQAPRRRLHSHQAWRYVRLTINPSPSMVRDGLAPTRSNASSRRFLSRCSLSDGTLNAIGPCRARLLAHCSTDERRNGNV